MSRDEVMWIIGFLNAVIYCILLFVKCVFPWMNGDVIHCFHVRRGKKKVCVSVEVCNCVFHVCVM